MPLLPVFSKHAKLIGIVTIGAMILLYFFWPKHQTSQNMKTVSTESSSIASLKAEDSDLAFSSCTKNDLKSWTDAYAFTDIYNKPGVYRTIYTSNRLSIEASGRACQCFFYNSGIQGDGPRTVYGKRIGKVQQNNIVWTSSPVSETFHDLASVQSSRLVNFSVGGGEGFLLVDFKDECPLSSVQQQPDKEMTPDQVCDCFGQ